MADAARGRLIRNPIYRNLAESDGEVVNELTATRDLAKLVEAGLLEPSGQRRGRSYTATPDLRDVWEAIRARRLDKPLIDPLAD
jgi:hypothetical protein